MKILLCYEKMPETLKAVEEILTANGFDCECLHYTKNEIFQTHLRKNGINAVVSSEIKVLSRCKSEGIAKIFVASDYCCLQKLSSKCDLYTIPSQELMFDFINSGATDKNVSVCGLPVSRKYMSLTDKKDACKKIGISGEKPVFTIFTSEATGKEVRSTIKTVLLLCKETRIILAVDDNAQKAYFSSLYSDDRNVYVIDEKGNESLCLSASDAVFTVAKAETATAVARIQKPLIIMHSSSVRCKENSKFLNKRGIGFCGKTAADNASYAGRLQESVRLKNNMTEAQRKYIFVDSDQKFFEKIYTFSEKFH